MVCGIIINILGHTVSSARNYSQLERIRHRSVGLAPSMATCRWTARARMTLPAVEDIDRGSRICIMSLPLSSVFVCVSFTCCCFSNSSLFYVISASPASSLHQWGEQFNSCAFMYQIVTAILQFSRWLLLFAGIRQDGSTEHQRATTRHVQDVGVAVRARSRGEEDARADNVLGSARSTLRHGAKVNVVGFPVRGGGENER